MTKIDADVREIVKLMYSVQADGEVILPAISLDNDFIERLQNVQFVILLFLRRRWQLHLEKYLDTALSSHADYVRLVVSACRSEEYLHLNIFESFLNVCNIAIFISVKIYHVTRLNFEQLTLDIIIVYYQRCLKRNFYKCGGFQRLLEYVRQHRYSTLDLFNGHYDNTADFKEIFKKEVTGKLEKEYNLWNTRQCVKIDSEREKEIVVCLVQEILLKTSMELPLLPNPAELAAKLVSFRKNSENSTHEELDAVSQGLLVLNSGSKPKREVENGMNNTQCDKIVEEIVRYNSSRNICFSDPGAGEVLNRLRDTIKSLIEALDQ